MKELKEKLFESHENILWTLKKKSRNSSYVMYTASKKKRIKIVCSDKNCKNTCYSSLL